MLPIHATHAMRNPCYVLPATHATRSNPICLDLRLEQELSKATLNNSPAHPNHKFSPHPKADKRGRSPSPTHHDTPSRRQPTSPPPYSQHDSPTSRSGRRKPSHFKSDRFFSVRCRPSNNDLLGLHTLPWLPPTQCRDLFVVDSLGPKDTSLLFPQ